MKTIATLGTLLLISAASTLAAAPYFGAGVGYWVDSKDAVYSARLGIDLAQQPTLLHAAEAEILYTRDKEFGTRLELTGFMANYRLTSDFASNAYITFGGGLGATRTKIKAGWFSDSDTAFSYQLLGGVGFRFTPQFSVEGTARYLNIGEATLGGFEADVGDDVALELGVKFRF